MGKKGGGSAPAAPDPVVLANTQGAINADTARLTQRLNMVDSYGPNGSVRYVPLGATGSGITTGTGTGTPANTNGFNAAQYLQNYPDVAAALADPAWAGKTALDHYNMFGQAEGRTFNPLTGAGTTPPPPTVNWNQINYSGALNNGVIDPYQGLAGGKTQYDSIRRSEGYTGDFGGGAFENWLKTQPYATQAKYAQDMINAGGDPDYLSILRAQMPAMPTSTGAPTYGAIPAPITGGSGNSTLPGGSGADALTDRWAQVTTLDPAQQESVDREKALNNQLLATASGQAGRVAQALSTPLSTNGLPELRGGVFGVGAGPDLTRSLSFDGVSPMVGANDFSADRSKVEGALFDRLNPQIDQRRNSLETKLLNQGITPGSPAWQKAQDDLSREVNDLRLGVTAQGGQEQSRMFGLGLTARQQGIDEVLQQANFGNTATGQDYQLRAADVASGNAARNQGLQERAYMTNTPINQIAALLAGTQVSMPQGINAPQVNVSSPDYMGAAMGGYQGQLQAWQQQQQNQNAMWGNIFGLGGSLGSAAILAPALSDRRAKRDIRQVGRLPNGLPIYSFRYKSGGPSQIGLMADDVERVNPAAVMEIDGMKHVDYVRAVA